MSAILGTPLMGIVNNDGNQDFVYQVRTPELRPFALVG